ncbi:MAG: lytic transglycosylase domain-containing protein [Nitrospirae bacterium]|nr:lytic transglycosylase domain-containing protein [Nitrospirota bacterium]
MFNFVYADIYRYVDENGVTCYTDTPFNKKANRIIKEKKYSSFSESTKKFKTSSEDPSMYSDIIIEKATAYDIDPTLIKAVIKTESNWNSRAVSRKGAMGLMQLMPSTANEMNVTNPFDPEDNIEGGTKYLKYLLERFNGDLTLALAAYNAGPGAVEKYGYIPPITETKQYVKKVLSHYNGKTVYPLTGSKTGKTDKKSEPIYKIVLEDGTILFTNSYLFGKNLARY